VPMKGYLKPGYSLAGRIDRTLITHPEPLFLPNTDEYWMEQALIESMNATGLSQPNPSVGCVLVKGMQEIARGFTQAYRQAHAERDAFSRIPDGTSLSDVTAYVTLEPCSHFGFQPPCVDLLLQSAIPRIVIAALDPDPRVNGEGIQKLRAAGKTVDLQILSEEARALNFPFFQTRSTQKTVWIGKWAQMPSGHLADLHGNSKWITGEKSRAYTHWLRQKYDCIVVGASTFLKDQPKLTVRDCAYPHHRNPIRFVFDPQGKLLQLPIDSLAGFRVLVSNSVLGLHSGMNSEVFVPIPVAPDSPDLAAAFRETLDSLTFERPLQSVMVEGGARLLNLLLGAGRFDALHIFTGQQKFLELSERERITWVPDESWSCVASHKFDDDLLQEWVKKD